MCCRTSRQDSFPALGEGAFFRAAKRYAAHHGFPLELFGRDIDPEVIDQAEKAGLDDEDLRHVEIRDFVLDPPSETFPAIIANPPYICHHRLSLTQKEQLRHFANTATGRHIDGRAGLHVYFLIRALRTLAGGFSPPAPTPPGIRVRTGRFPKTKKCKRLCFSHLKNRGVYRDNNRSSLFPPLFELDKYPISFLFFRLGIF